MSDPIEQLQTDLLKMREERDAYMKQWDHERSKRIIADGQLQLFRRMVVRAMEDLAPRAKDACNFMVHSDPKADCYTTNRPPCPICVIRRTHQQFMRGPARPV